MARERYLLHGDEKTINQPGTEIKADSRKAKWENFWFYHKWHVLIVIAVILTAVFFIHDLTSKVNPDYQIAMITQTTYPTEVTESLENQIAQHGTDLNGDGKVIVQVNSYVIADNSSSGTAADPNMQMAGVVKLSADLSEGTSMIFITDEASFKDEQKKGQIFAYIDGTTPAEGALDYDKMWKSLEDCHLANPKTVSTDGKSQNILKNLNISLRVFQDTGLAKNKDEVAYYAASKKLFDQLK